MLCLLQARMSSSRLPKKMLRNVDDKTLLAHVIDRILKSKKITKLIVATSYELSDQPLVEYCKKNQITYFEGALEDVASRLLDAATIENADAFVRICGDSPLIDPHLIDKAIEHYESANYDLVTNTLLRTFPKGQSIEVLRTSTFRSAYINIKTNEQKEHVTKIFYDNPNQYKIFNFTSGGDFSSINLCIDTIDDLKLVEMLLISNNSQNASWIDYLKTMGIKV